LWKMDLTTKTRNNSVEAVPEKQVSGSGLYQLRKAIAKAKYHRSKSIVYLAHVSTKARGKLKDYPGLAKKMAGRKEGITKTGCYSESVAKSNTHAQHVEEKVDAVYIKEQNRALQPTTITFLEGLTDPNRWMSSSFPNAFSYYKFEFVGSLTAGKLWSSKLKVIPRSRVTMFLKESFSL